MLAPSTRAADLAAGRRALQQGAQPDVIALCPSLPVARRTHMGVPVGVRASLTHALVNGRYDIVHGFEPGLPSLSYLALLHAESLAVATFLSPERLGYPPRRAQREKLLARVDALLATSPEAAAAARERFPGSLPGRRRGCRHRAVRTGPEAASSPCWSGVRASGRSSARSSARSPDAPAGSSCSCAPGRARDRPCRAA